MSEIKKRAIAITVIMTWLATGYIFSAEPKTFDSGETQVSLIETFHFGRLQQLSAQVASDRPRESTDLVFVNN